MTVAPQKAEFTKHGAFVKAGVAMAMTVLANATTHIKDIVEDGKHITLGCNLMKLKVNAEDTIIATVSKMQALTPAKVEQFAKPIQFHWADEEVEGQEVIPVALINTEFANNGAFLKAAAAMGEAKLETVGHVDNEIVEDGKHIRSKPTIIELEMNEGLENDNGNSPEEADIDSYPSRVAKAHSVLLG